jgi:hypothetical protein
MTKRKETIIPPAPHKGGRPHKYEGQWAKLVERAGGVGRLAEMIGTSTQLIWYWANGMGKPRESFQNQIKKVARGLSTRPPAFG